MGTVDKQGVVTMQELLVSNLAHTDALTKLLIEKGLINFLHSGQKRGRCNIFLSLILAKQT